MKEIKSRLFWLLRRLLGEFTISQWQCINGKWMRVVFAKSKDGFRFYIDGESAQLVWQAVIAKNGFNGFITTDGKTVKLEIQR